MRRFALAVACALACCAPRAGRRRPSRVVGQDRLFRATRRASSSLGARLQPSRVSRRSPTSQRGFFQMNWRRARPDLLLLRVRRAARGFRVGGRARHGRAALTARSSGGETTSRRLSSPNGHERPVELVANSEGSSPRWGTPATTVASRASWLCPVPLRQQAYSPVGRYSNGSSPLHSVYRWWQTNQSPPRAT